MRGDETRRGNRSDRSVADERVFCHERNDVVTSSFVILLCDRRIRPPALLGRTIPIPLLRRLLGALTRLSVESSPVVVRSAHVIADSIDRLRGISRSMSSSSADPSSDRQILSTESDAGTEIRINIHLGKPHEVN